MYIRIFIYSLKYFFKSAVRLWLFAAGLLCAALPLIFVSTPAVPVALYDLDGSPESARVCADIASSGTLDVQPLNYDDALEKLKTGALEAVFELKSGFGEAMKRGEYTSTVTMRLSAYSTGARTLSDSVAAAVMREYAVNSAGRAVLAATGDKALAGLAYEKARNADVEIVEIKSTGLTAAHAGDGVNTALSALGAFLCFAALCFSAPVSPALRQKLISVSAEPLAAAVCAQAGKLVPITLLCLIPLFVTGSFEYGAAVLGLFALYALCLCVIGALVSRLSPPVRLSFAVFFSILNAIFALSAVFNSSPSLISALFPGYWLSQGISALSRSPYIGLLIITAALYAPAAIRDKLKN